MTQEQLPAFATNNSSMTVAAEINKMYRIIRSKLAVTPAAAIATAYINPAGFALLADELNQVPRVRLLLGAEPQEDIVRAIVDLGHSLGLRVVAEGVEEEAARDALREMHCDQAQGFLISRPMPLDRFEAWLQARTVSIYDPASTTHVLRMMS